MLILNLGCGSKTANDCINLDWSPYLRLKKNIFLRVLLLPFIGKRRRDRLSAISENITLHDLKKPLPFVSNSVDAVFHSHVLEHIDREHVKEFLAEIHRVLRPGGIHRVCVPDLELIARRYLKSCEECRKDSTRAVFHDEFVSDLLEQSVRKQAFGSMDRPVILRRLENLILGDARARGETHQWMYDRFNLEDVMKASGFCNISILSWNHSSIPGWEALGLESDEKGLEYKTGSLYMEGIK